MGIYGVFFSFLEIAWASIESVFFSGIRIGIYGVRFAFLEIALAPIEFVLTFWNSICGVEFVLHCAVISLAVLAFRPGKIVLAANGELRL
jgi:hypothetical protein